MEIVMKYHAPGAAVSALIAALVCAGAALPADAAEPAKAPNSAPNFAPDAATGWLAQDDEFIAPPSGPGPIASDPEHPYVSFYKQPRNTHPAFRIADLTNPILQPWTRERLKHVNERVTSGEVVAIPKERCWPVGMPGFLLLPATPVFFLQTAKDVRMIWMQDHQVRDVRLDAEHPADLKPSWYGDSVGHYEGDTLVVDTVGVRTDRPFAMIDLFGTPYSKSLHIVERYRLRAYDDVKDAIERNKKENWLFAGDPFSNHRGKFLQLHVTIEDEGVFTTPWTATMTYVPGPDVWPETVCAENTHQYYSNDEADVPRADKPDF
jgi:hypothetical protein